MGIRSRVSSVIVCHACDLAHRFDGIASGSRVRCVRCRAELYRTNSREHRYRNRVGRNRLVLLDPRQRLSAGRIEGERATRVCDLLWRRARLYSQGYSAIAVLVVFTTVLVPLSQILAFLYVLVAVRTKRRVPGRDALFRTLAALRPWAMAEVFMLGALVALVKLSALAEVSPASRCWRTACRCSR